MKIFFKEATLKVTFSFLKKILFQKGKENQVKKVIASSAGPTSTGKSFSI